MKHQITLEQAVNMTRRFNEHKKNIINPAFPGKEVLPNAETFDRAIFDYVLSRPGCTGLRVYFGLNDALQLRAVIVGVNANNEDMLPAEITATTLTTASITSDTTTNTNTTTTLSSDPTDPTGPTGPTEGGDVIIEEGNPCPPYCPEPSPLNP